MRSARLSTSVSGHKIVGCATRSQHSAPAPDFQKSSPELASSPAPESFKFEREDWTLFRTVEGLQQKAGVSKQRLRRLVLKELADNGLDTGAPVKVGEIDGGYYVEDRGLGIEPEQISSLFSIARPLVSTKLLRLPTRGALGNGLRVVAGAVLASDGSLAVITRNRRIELRPERDGATTVISAKPIEFPIGTRVEISFGPALPPDQGALSWAQIACHLARGATYSGRSSPWWYDLPQFHELLYASGDRPVRELIAHLDGCTGAKAGEIVAAAGLSRAICKKVTRDQTATLLKAARDNARPVKRERLGAVGSDAYDGSYATSSGVVEFGSTMPLAEVPFVVEIWASKSKHPRTKLIVCINRTPITGTVEVARDKRDIDAFGCGLAHTIAQAPVGLQFSIVMNLITPYVPITSDGKEPNLQPFLDVIRNTAGKVVRKAHRPTSGDRTSQKDIVLENLDAVIADVSGDGQYRFGQRQLLYGLRPIIRDETGETLQRRAGRCCSCRNREAKRRHPRGGHCAIVRRGARRGMARSRRGSSVRTHRRRRGGRIMTATSIETSIAKRRRRPRPAVRKPIEERHVARLHLRCTNCGRPTRPYDIALVSGDVVIECPCGLRSEISWQE